MPEKTQKWKPKQIIYLIELIKEKPCLWNVNVKDYRDKSKRHKALMDIAKRFHVSTEQIKKKLFNMRIQYMHERRKLQRIERETGEQCKPVWQYYNNLHFIYENNCENEQKPIAETQSMWTHFMAKGENDNEVLETDPIAINDDVQSPSPTSQIFISSPAYSNSNSSMQVVDPREIKLLSKYNQRDEYDVFGEYVASELRLLHDLKDVQYTLKTSILKSILEANTAVQSLTMERA